MNDKVVPFDKDKSKDAASTDKLDALTAHLTDSLEPKSPIFSTTKRSIIWLGSSLIYFALVVLLTIPLRSDIADALMHSSLSIDTILSVLMFFTASFAAIKLMEPVPKDQLFKYVSIPLASLAIFALWSGYRTYDDMVVHHDHNHGGHGVFDFQACFWESFVFVALPAAVLVYFARRGASTNPWWLHTMAFIAIFAFGWMGLRLTCGLDHAGHAFIFHFLPFVLLGGVSGLLSRNLFRTI